MNMKKIETALRYLLGIILVVAGVGHFVSGDLFVQIVPDYLPAPMLLVYLSGLAEIAVGVGLQVERVRQWAAWGAIALFVAVFPANVYMAQHNIQLEGLPGWIPQPSQAALWLRLPLQAVLITWAWMFTRPAGASAEPETTA